MRIKLFISLLAILSIAQYQFVYAHENNRDYNDYETRKETEKSQRANDSWDKFLKAVKKQDEEKHPDEKPGNGSSDE